MGSIDQLINSVDALANQIALEQNDQDGLIAGAAKADAPFSALDRLNQAWVLPGATSVTVNVPADAATIPAALSAIGRWVIPESSTVTIDVADGTYNLTASVSLNHPFGERIRLIGNVVTPANCVLNWAASGVDGLSVSAAHKFGYIDGFTIKKPVKATLADNTTAILAVQHASIITGSNISVDNWYYGIAARDHSYVYCPGVTVNHAGDVGIWAFCGSTIVCNNATSLNASDTTNGYGYGFQAEFGSMLVGTGITATGCNIAGIAALSNSTARVHDSSSTANVGSGYLSRDGGQVEAVNGVATSNSRYGIEIIGYGAVLGVATNSGNTLGVTNPFAYFDNFGGAQGRITTSVGPLRVDSPDTSPVYFNTSGGLQGEVRHIGSATSRAYLQGGSAATSDQPHIGLDGAAANISGQLRAKGTGEWFIANDSGVLAEIYNTAGGVDWVGLSNGAGFGRVQAVGPDTDIDLLLAAKGTGQVRFGALTASADAPITGYITIKDAAGNVRKLAVVS